MRADFFIFTSSFSGDNWVWMCAFHFTGQRNAPASDEAGALHGNKSIPSTVS